MRTIDEIFEQVRQLPATERRQLLDRLEDTLAEEELLPEKAPAVGSYAPLLALAGTVHSDFTDVSTDKYAHLAAAFGDERDDR